LKNPAAPAAGSPLRSDKLQGIFDRKDFLSNFYIRSLTPQQAAGNALGHELGPNGARCCGSGGRPMLFRKEREVGKLLVKHLNTVEECITTGIRTIQEYLSGNIKDAKELAKQVDAIETRADLIRYEIRDKLYAGAYLPRLREDIYRLIEGVDEVANATEACCDFFLNQRPDVPEAVKAEFSNAVRESLGIVEPLKEAFMCFFEKDCENETARRHVKEVGVKESDVDHIEWDLTKKIFTLDGIDFGRKIHLKLCLNAVTAVADQAKYAADHLDLVILKSTV